MYQVYSTQRPGRPGWALVANGALLAATVGLAAGVVHLRQTSSSTALGEVTVYEQVGLQARVPVNWKVGPAIEDAGGAVLPLVEPGSRREPGRQLLLFRYSAEPSSLSVGAEETVPILNRVVRMVGIGVVMMPSEQLGNGPVGPYPGVTVLLSPVLQMRGMQTYPAGAIGRVAVAPSGDVLGAVLLLAEDPRSSDLRLLERVCQGITSSADADRNNPPERLLDRVGELFTLGELAFKAIGEEARPPGDENSKASRRDRQ